MSIILYKILHVIGALLVFISFGLLIGRVMLAPDNIKLRKLGGIVSGIGLFLLLLGGFGLIAKLQYSYLSWWLLLKYASWLTLGAMTALINRKAEMAMTWFWVTIGVGVVATALGLGKFGLGM